MHTKTAILVVYNHRFDKNISRINALYYGKFSHVYHLMPFYDGEENNVIPVYESSYQFQSYISQAYTHLRNQGFTHYLVVSDDMVLNPAINEHNLWELLQLDYDSCMLPGFIELQTCKIKRYARIKDAINYKIEKAGTEVKNLLPSYEEASKRFHTHGISTEALTPSIYEHLYPRKERFGMKLWRTKALPSSIKLNYPLVAGYSDIFLVTADCMQRFCTYCGAFAAGNLFVEVAIPTAMVLATEKLAVLSPPPTSQNTHKLLALKRGDMWPGEKMTLQNHVASCNHSLKKLLATFPEGLLFLHPIKLSAWK